MNCNFEIGLKLQKTFKITKFNIEKVEPFLAPKCYYNENWYIKTFMQKTNDPYCHKI